MVLKLQHLVKNGLHHDLGIAPGKKIPLGDEEAALHSKSKRVRKRAQFAINARKWHHESKEVKEGFLDNVKKATGAKTKLGGVAAGIADVAADALAGELVWPGPGALIGAAHGVYSVASNIRAAAKAAKAKKAASMSEEEMLAAYENHPIEEGLGKLIVKGLFAKPKAERSNSRSNAARGTQNRAKDNDVDQEPDKDQFRDPDTGRITPQYWQMGRVVDTGKKSMHNIIADKARDSGAAHHQANYSPEAKAKNAATLAQTYRDHPNVGEIVHYPNMPGKKAPDWVKRYHDAKRGPGSTKPAPTVLNKKKTSSLETDAKNWMSRRGRKMDEDVTESLIHKASGWIHAKSRKEAVYDKSKTEHKEKTRPIDKLDAMSFNANKRGDKKKSDLYWRMAGKEIDRVAPRVKSLELRMAAVHGGNMFIPNSPERPRDLKYMSKKVNESCGSRRRKTELINKIDNEQFIKRGEASAMWGKAYRSFDDKPALAKIVKDGQDANQRAIQLKRRKDAVEHSPKSLGYFKGNK